VSQFNQSTSNRNHGAISIYRLHQYVTVKTSSFINARLHTSLATRQKLRELDWEVLMHLPYSPDLAPLDYHLSWSLQNLNRIKLPSKEACENYLSQFFDNTRRTFIWIAHSQWPILRIFPLNQLIIFLF